MTAVSRARSPTAPATVAATPHKARTATKSRSTGVAAAVFAVALALSAYSVHSRPASTSARGPPQPHEVVLFDQIWSREVRISLDFTGRQWVGRPRWLGGCSRGCWRGSCPVFTLGITLSCSLSLGSCGADFLSVAKIKHYLLKSSLRLDLYRWLLDLMSCLSPRSARSQC